MPHCQWTIEEVCIMLLTCTLVFIFAFSKVPAVCTGLLTFLILPFSIKGEFLITFIRNNATNSVQTNITYLFLYLSIASQP